MKILFLTNNPVANGLADWLRKRPEIDQVVLLSEKLTIELANNIDPDFIISYSYRYIIGEQVILGYPSRVINLHISYLPFNKGADPNVWSFLDDTPKGVTIHLVDKGLDTGKTLLQKQVFFDENLETLSSSYNVLHQEIQSLFMENWGLIYLDKLKAVEQPSGGIVHKTKEFAQIQNELLGTDGWNVRISDLKERYAQFMKKNLV